MPVITISHHITHETLYEGLFADIKSAIERAAIEDIDLSHADLRHANLGNAELDGLVMRGARLDGANLAGANLSEAWLEGSIFLEAGLQNTCLCFSMLARCDFSGAQFGATDVAGACLDRARFATPSAFTLNFSDAESMQHCLYLDEALKPCVFSRPPIVITGLSKMIAVMDRHVLSGSAAIDIGDFLAHSYLRMNSTLH